MFKALPPVLLALSLSACVPPQAQNGGARNTEETTVPVGGPAQVGQCAPGYVRPDLAVLERDLAAARERWTAAGVRDYSHDFAQVSAPLRFPTVRVSVRGGMAQAVSLAPGETGEPSPQARATVEDRFANIAQALEAQREQPCPAVEVEYDGRDGHPTRFYSGTRQANVADGWGEWRITNFTRP
ncbi:hypothetical protein DAETH_25260 [Deinococcus aetherius]|uniref:Lipoprotein n=1 Tax=Deinococcus aetherius TaxID=200252 RepID=A0ABM8AFI9_9DEIO|nr:DUF6174 domain-containing protein [Deinococcus aetherius]BDP42557.1 hypothetical protein DAETH_25260 [Deinococcus aetherius]